MFATDPAWSAGSVAASFDRPHVSVLDGRTAPLGELGDRILAAALRLIGRWGMGKTTLADVAREAGCSRATVYRIFPGGKQELFLALGRSELTDYFAAIETCIDAADTAEVALTEMIVLASQRLVTHDALQYVLVHEPDIVLPFLGFHQIDRLYAAAADSLAPALERLLPGRSRWAVEWAARSVLTYAFNPSTTVDLQRRADAHLLVRRFLIPALQPLPALAVPA